MPAALRTLKIVHAAMTLAALLYVGIAEKLNNAREVREINLLYTVISVQVLLVVAIAFFIRARMVSNSAELLRDHANNTTALNRWRAGQIVTLAFAELVVLFGLVLRFIGASRAQVLPFCFVGLIMFVLFYPHEP